VRKVRGGDLLVIGGRLPACENRGDKAVASPRQSSNESRTILSVSQRFSETGYMKAHATFFNGNSGPYPRHQLFFAADFVRRRSQGDQDIESARAQLDGNAFSW